MNKEEIKCITKEQLNQLEWSDTHEYGTTLAYELIERIDKAIELILKECCDENDEKRMFYDLDVPEVYDLLEILKGDSNDKN